MFRQCTCRQPPFHFSDFDIVDMGEDQYGAGISLSSCKHCRTSWLEYLVEEPQYSRSGRWWRVEVPAEHMGEATVANARAYIESAAQGFAGGSYFDSNGHPIAAPIAIR
jgi:hypothetical protein